MTITYLQRKSYEIVNNETRPLRAHVTGTITYTYVTALALRTWNIATIRFVKIRKQQLPAALFFILNI